MRPIPSAILSQPAIATAADRKTLKRGLINGAILSLAMWMAGGYLAFILH